MFWWIILLCVILGFVFREKLLEYIYGLLDIYFQHQFEKVYHNDEDGKKREFFQSGWGDDEKMEILHDYLTSKNRTKVADKIKVEWVEDNENKKIGGRIRLGKFLSPLSEILPEGSEHAHFLLIEPKEKTDRLLVIPPAGGQMGFGWRLKNIAGPMLKKGFSVVLTVYPVGKHRIPKKNNGKIIQSTDTVSDWVAIIMCNIQEVRSLTRYLIEEHRYRNVCLTGMSWGGIIVTQSVRWGILPEDTSAPARRIVCVPCMANDFCGSKPFCKRSEVVRNLPKCTWKGVLRYSDNDQEGEFFSVLYQILNFYRAEKRYFADTELKDAIVLISTRDCYHTKEDYELSVGYYKKLICESYGGEVLEEGEEGKALKRHLEIRYMKCGHFTPFTFVSVRKKYYFRAILDIFRKLEKNE